MAGVPWKTSDLRTLRSMAGTHTSAEIGAVLGRSSDAVKHQAKAMRLSLFRRGENAPQAKYSDALIEGARQLHEQGFGPRWIAQRLGINERTLLSALYFRQRVGA